MLEIRTLGRLDVRRADGEEIASVLGAPKRFALLAHLAVESTNGPRRRDALLALFWPEKDGRSARNALNVTLHELRSALGRDAIVSHGTELVGVDPATVRCDAVDLNRALADGRHEEALALYAGEFLPGFHLSDAPGFEKWLDAQRERLRRGALEAARTLARNAGDERPEVAIRWLRRGLAIAPLDERLARGLVRRLDGAGDRAGAIRAYERFAKRLHAELGVEPSPETREVAERIRTRSEANGRVGLTRGAGRAGPLDPVVARGPSVNSDAHGSTASAPTAGTQEGMRLGRAGSWLRDRIAPAVLLLFLAATGLVVARVARGPDVAESHLPQPTLEVNPDLFLVVPFETGGASPELTRYDQGMVDLIGARLAGDPSPRAIDARTTISRLDQRSREKDGPLEPADWRAVARELGAGGVISGSVVGSPTEVVIAARLTDAVTGELRASAIVDTMVVGPGAVSPLALVDAVTTRLLTIDAGEPPTRLASMSPSFEAVQNYLAGKRAYRGGQIREAYDHYDRALAFDSTFVYAALGLLETCQGWSGVPPCYRRAKSIGWEHADALNRIDRLYLRVVGGEDLEHPDDMTRTEAARLALEAAPERLETRFEWADQLFHSPAKLTLGGPVDAAWDRAEVEFERILAEDPQFEPALDHLLKLQLARVDRAAVDSLADVYARRFPGADGVQAVTWWQSWLREDEIGPAVLLTSLDDLSDRALARLLIPAFEIPGMDPAYVERALDLLDERPGSGGPIPWFRYRLAMSRGRPTEAMEHIRGRWIEDLAIVESALYAMGDSEEAARVSGELAGSLEGPPPVPDDLDAVREHAWGLCISEQWRLWHGETSTAPRSIRLLRELLPSDPTWETTREAQECPILLEAILATVQDQRDARRKIEHLERHHARTDGGTHVYYAHLLLARLWGTLGDPARALEGIRRRCRFCPGFRYPADALRIEGRLAAKLGRTDEAIRAYEHYLSLRSDPEPSVRPQVDSVRAELRRLRAEASPREDLRTAPRP